MIPDKSPDADVLRFAVSEIKDKGSACFKGKVPCDEFRAAVSDSAALAGPISVEMNLVVQDGLIGLSGRVGGSWKVACCRCLADTVCEYRAELEEEYPMTLTVVDGAEEVRQALVMAVPLQVFCKPDCKGLCLQCGVNKNLSECACRPQLFNSPIQRRKDAKPKT